MLDRILFPNAPMFGRRVLDAAADFYGTLATPAKNVATMFGAQPENHTPPAPMFSTHTPEYRWNLGMMKDLQREGNIPAAMDYAGRVQGARDQQERNVQDAALGFAGTIGPGKPIRAYHGSPYDFDKFDMTKIGTGEGAQAYGHGLYFAQNEGVARSYRDVLSGTRGAKAGDVDVSAWAAREPGNALWLGEELQKAGALVGQSADSPAAMNLIINRVAGLKSQTMHPAHDRAMAALDQIEGALSPQAKEFIKKNFAPPPGRMYEVNIHADPNKMLDWDKPLGVQPAGQSLLKMGVNTVKGVRPVGPDTTGASAYSSMRWAADPDKGISDAVASATLRDAGIPGIKYLDQGSRAAGDGSRNYVLFRDDIIDIVRKYGFIPPMFGRRPEDK